MMTRPSPTFQAFAPLSLIFCLGCPPEYTADIGPAQTTSGSPGSSSTGEPPVPTTEPEPLTSTEDAPSTTTSAPDDDTTATPSTTGGEDCGDGVINGREQCDDGYSNNKLDNLCLPSCELARCGDGFVQSGVEDCDFTDDGNGYDYGGCLPITCKWGPRCGDGHLDTPEEVCDPGDPDGQDAESVSCDLSCRFAGRIVFLSSGAYSGNLGGLAGADAICRDLAATFDVKRADSYVAWLSDGEQSPQDRIAHGPEFDDSPYVLRNGVPIAANFKDLTDHGPWPGIDLTDTYESVVDVRVWTNTSIDGTRFSDDQHCEGWGSDSFALSARIGVNRLPPDSPDLDAWQQFGYWTSWQARSCNKPLHIYCLEN